MDNNTIKLIAFTIGGVIIGGLAMFGVVRICNAAADKLGDGKKEEPKKLDGGKK